MRGKIIVTGANGFTGKYLMRELAEYGFQAVGIWHHSMPEHGGEFEWHRIDLMAELRGDIKSRAAWFSTMRNIGVFSPNDIRALEDIPDVEGGDDRYASLNYIPLADWKRLSEQRNGGKQNANQP